MMPCVEEQSRCEPDPGGAHIQKHDLFIQSMKLKNTLRHLKGEEMITHLGLEYYD